MSKGDPNGCSEENEVTVIGHPVAAVQNKKPPEFFQGFWSPISYILYLWYSPILNLVSFASLLLCIPYNVLCCGFSKAALTRLCSFDNYSIPPDACMAHNSPF